MFTLEEGDTGEAILPAPQVKDVRAYQSDDRVKLLVGLSRWERAGMLAWIAALEPDVFDAAANALVHRE